MARAVEASVIVPTIGREEQLQRCMVALDRCDPKPAEVVVVDQSRAGVARAVTASMETEAIRVIDDAERGSARARNVGTRAARYDLLLFTDDDCVPRPDWIEAAERLHRLQPTALLTGQVLPENGNTRIPSTIVGTTAIDYSGTHHCAVLYSNNMVVSRAQLLAAGAFDERFPIAGGEDNDLCYRWLVAGRMLRFEPGLIVEHLDWRNLAELKAVQRQYARTQGMFYAKHLRLRDPRMLVFLIADLRARLLSLRTYADSPGPIPLGQTVRSIGANWRRFRP